VCGLVGFVQHPPHGNREETVRRMAATLRHRGPDSEGYFIDGAVALGVRRLSIVDHLTGAQPVTNEARTVWAALNGEIYNFGELRALLERLGHTFATQSDTEVLVHAYEQYGDSCVEHLDGMFAFAIWDAIEERLMLARDRMGEKPLYYADTPGAFVFGSEIRALLAHGAVARRLNLTGLSSFLAYEYVPDPESIIEGVRRLPPGHRLTLTAGSEPKLEQYWDILLRPEHSVDEAEWVDRLRCALAASVRRRVVADVPVGALLSGGIDSSAVAALAVRESGKRLNTFSVGVEDPTHDERMYARLVAERIGTDHHELVFGWTDARALIEHAGDLMDEPLVDASFLPMYALSRFARNAVTVTLSGDGGDELFCGYPSFLAERASRWLDVCPRWLIDVIRRAVERRAPSSSYGAIDVLLRQFLRGHEHPPGVRTQVWLGGITTGERSALLAPSIAASCADTNPYEALQALRSRFGDGDPIAAAIYQHCKFYLAGQNLVTVDRASMAASLEVRAPFLDHNIVELAGRMPSSLKLRRLTMKYVLKRAMEDSLPSMIVWRRKHGFALPTAEWLRGPLRPLLHEQLRPEAIARVGLFNPETISQLITEHSLGRRDHRKVLWGLLMFDAWRQRYLPNECWT
jgi:asparagine synthase (glutamine-hydrolysing)